MQDGKKEANKIHQIGVGKVKTNLKCINYRGIYMYLKEQPSFLSISMGTSSALVI